MRRWASVLNGVGLTALAVIGINVLPACDETPSPSLLGKPRVPSKLEFEKRSHRHLDGLAEDVTFVKGLGANYVIRADGSIEHTTDVLRADDAAWRAKHGALSPEIAQLQVVQAPQTAIDIAILFDPLDGDWNDYIEDQDSDDPQRSQVANDALTLAIRTRAATLIAELAAAGIQGAISDTTAPIVQARVTTAQLSLVSAMPGIRSVIGNGQSTPIENANNDVNPVTFHNTTAFSQTGSSSIKIGSIEPGGCRVRDTNYLVSATMIYSGPLTGRVCSVALDCAPCGGPPHGCVGGRCMDGHGTAATSVLTQIVPDSPIVYPNALPTSGDVVCGPYLPNTYSFLKNEGVKFVNESYSCDEDGVPSNINGVVQDYHSRVNNMLVTKSSGNGGQEEFGCPDTWNSVCVGSVDAESELSCFTSTRNLPITGIHDREEPDVMAYGGQFGGGDASTCSGTELDQVIMASATSDFGTLSGNGTSAPPSRYDQAFGGDS